MEKLRIITDSASDISAADEQRLNIGMLPFQVVLGGQSYTSRVDFDNEGFYALMAQHDEVPLTSQITPFEFEQVYLQHALAGYTELILVLINSAGSATWQNSVQAIDLFYDEYPQYRGRLRIRSFDSRGYSLLYGAPVLEAARRCAAGETADSICTYLEQTLPRRQVYFGMYTLRYAGRSGRIPSAAAFLGDKLNLKPVMKIFDHEIVTAAKCRGEARLLPRIAEMTLAAMEPGTPYDIVYGDDPVCRDALAEQMTALTGYAPAGFFQIGAAVAANAGPRVAGTGFLRRAE